jgi:hypothetical protein
MHEMGTSEWQRCTAQKRTPTFLVLGGTLSECQPDSGVLGDLLWEGAIDSRQVGETLRGEDAHHAGLSRAREQGNDVSALASQRGELVDNDQTGPGACAATRTRSSRIQAPIFVANSG